MSIWFEGEDEINCSLDDVRIASENLGEHYRALIELMPSITSVELVDQSDDSVTLRTNEGLMRRTNIIRQVADDRVTFKFDEEYQAGSMVRTSAHFVDGFRREDGVVRHHLAISDIQTRGLLGFFYRRFGARSTGRAFLAAYKTYLERAAGHV